MKKILCVIIVLAVAGGVWWWFGRDSGAKPTAVQYRTSVIGRATITQDVSATGTIQPLREVEVGTQVTGKIIELNADYNSEVKAGQILAKIDPATYQASYDASRASVKSAEASLASAKAQLAAAEATLAVNESKLKFGKKTHNRNLELRRHLPQTGISDADLEVSEAVVEQLEAQILSNKADIEKAKAAILQSEAQVKQAEANGRQSEANLGYCTIAAPIDGVVISKDVDEGQTVVSNMNTSTLFTLATDLTKIQVEASVPEADVGQLRVGQKVQFTVDAYQHAFNGTVKEIRLDAQSESNVVTYPVIVEAANPKKELFPGMTANLSIIIAEKTNVVSVPAAALRFKGAAGAAMPQEGVGGKPGEMGGMPGEMGGMPGEMGGRPGEMGGKSGPDGGKSGDAGVSMKTIWLSDGRGGMRPVPVRLGASDGVNTEIIGGEKLEGQEVVTGVMTAREIEQKAGSNNPFAPKPPKGGPPGPPPR